MMENKEAKVILDKVFNLIETGKHTQKPVIERYISLANRRLLKLSQGKDVWPIVAASLGLNNKFTHKFGIFLPRSKAVKL